MRRFRLPLLEETVSLGTNVVELMSEAYTADFSKFDIHDRKVQELERRRREVKRDFDALQKQRLVEGQVIEG